MVVVQFHPRLDIQTKAEPPVLYVLTERTCIQDTVSDTINIFFGQKLQLKSKMVVLFCGCYKINKKYLRPVSVCATI